MSKQITVLITGATGNVGSKLRNHLGDRYALKLIDRDSCGDPDITEMDLSNWDDRIVQLFSDVDVVVHLAADPYDTKSWEELIPSNLDALANVFIAATMARVPRVIFASSNHVMGGYKNETGIGRWLTTKLAHKPGTHYESPVDNQCDSTPYGAMKLCGERLGRSYAQSTNAVCIAIRLGWVNRIGENQLQDLPSDADIWFKRMWLSTRDLGQLMEQAIKVSKPSKSFLVLNGMSDNENMVWDIEATKVELGYQPKDGFGLLSR
jgi:uronate dehydrogenase